MTEANQSQRWGAYYEQLKDRPPRKTLLRALGRETAVGAFEINFSCPNVAAGGARFWADPARLEATLKGLRRLTAKPLIAKLSPDVTDIRETARACERGGADAVTAVNTFVVAASSVNESAESAKANSVACDGATRPVATGRCWAIDRPRRWPASMPNAAPTTKRSQIP